MSEDHLDGIRAVFPDGFGLRALENAWQSLLSSSAVARASADVAAHVSAGPMDGARLVAVMLGRENTLLLRELTRQAEESVRPILIVRQASDE